VTLTPILPVAPAPASATDPEPSGGDGARFQRTLTEASGRYRADGAGARIRGVKERPDNPCESGTDASLPAASNVANAADTGPATARAVDAALLVQTGAVTVAPVPGPPSVALPVQPGMGEPGLVRQPAGFSGRPSNALASPGSPASPDSPATPVTIPLAAATTFATVAAAPATAVTAGTVATSTASTAAATMPAKPGSPSASRDTALVPPAGPRAASTVDRPRRPPPRSTPGRRQPPLRIGRPRRSLQAPSQAPAGTPRWPASAPPAPPPSRARTAPIPRPRR
jgi:hypothetical protein